MQQGIEDDREGQGRFVSKAIITVVNAYNDVMVTEVLVVNGATSGESRMPVPFWALKLALTTLSLFIIVAEANAQNKSLYVYPSKGQSQAQQDKDKYECQTWAKSQSGFDPSVAQSASSTQQQKPQGHVVRGAGRGAALGAVGGAIAGDAGTGAAAGAAMGGLAGEFRRRDARRQQQANGQAATSSGQDAYNRALAACLQGRGYTVN